MAEQTVLDSSEFQKLAKRRAPKGKKAKKEEKIQISISKYVKAQYPDVIFNSDIASGMRLPIWIAASAKAMRSERGQPDMVFLEPRGGYCGLCIEVKKDEAQVFNKNGEMKGGKSAGHLREQVAILERLRAKGYKAEFGLGFEDTKKIIDEYMLL
jgi:hypothetical protein